MPPIDFDEVMRIISEHPVFRSAGYASRDFIEHAHRSVRDFIYSIPSLNYFLSRHRDTRTQHLIRQMEDACNDLYVALHGKLLMDLRENITAANYPDNRGYNAAQRNYFHDRNNLNVAEETYRIAIQRIFLLSQMILNRTSYKLPTQNDGILFLAELFCSQDRGYEMNTDEISDRDLAHRVAQLCGHQRLQNEDGTTSFQTSEELPTVTYNEETGDVARYAEDRRQALVTSGPSASLSHGERIPEGAPFDVHHYEPGEVFPGTHEQQQHRAARALAGIDNPNVLSPIRLDARQGVASFQRGRIAASNTRRTQRRDAHAVNALMDLGNAPADVGRVEKRVRDEDDDDDSEDGHRDKKGGAKRRQKTNKKRKANKKRKTVKKRKIVKKRKTVRRR